MHSQKSYYASIDEFVNNLHLNLGPKCHVKWKEELETQYTAFNIQECELFDSYCFFHGSQYWTLNNHI